MSTEVTVVVSKYLGIVTLVQKKIALSNTKQAFIYLKYI